MRILFLLCSLLLLAACEQLGIDDPAKLAAAVEAEGKAIGGGCRYTGRSIEDCYSLNPRARKAAIFAGWLEMDGYMRDNKLESAAQQAAAAKVVAAAKLADARNANTETPPAAGARK